MTPIQWIGLGIAALGVALTALMRVWKIGPWNDMQDFTDLDYLPNPTEPSQSPDLPSTGVLQQNTPSALSTPKTPSNGQIKPTLTEICTYMRDFEGKPGDANYRNNNPLNCKFYDGGYLPQYLPVLKSSAGFAIFKNYQTGWLYGFNMLKNKIQHHPNWTLYDMIADHAPASDKNPVLQYASNVAKRASVDIHFPVNQIVLV